MAKLRINVEHDASKKITKLTANRGSMRFYYNEDGLCNLVESSGKFSLEEMEFINRRYIDNILNIANISNIEMIEEANIKTVGADNIIIDKLTQSATTARYHEISNNGNTTVTYGGYISPVYEGKFFARGCRGFIGAIYVRAQETAGAAGTITVYIAPKVGMAPIITKTINVLANQVAAYLPCLVNQFWNFDSMFIYLRCNAVTTQFGWETPVSGYLSDGFYSTDDGVTWGAAIEKYLIKVDMYAASIGDIPVSGTINNIPMPNTVSARQNEYIDNIDAGMEAYDTIINKTGQLITCFFVVFTDNARDFLSPRIYCDGEPVLPFHFPIADWHEYLSAINSGGMYDVTCYNTTDHRYVLAVLIKLPFQKTLKIGFLNTSAIINDLAGYVAYTYETII